MTGKGGRERRELTAGEDDPEVRNPVESPFRV